MSLIWQAGNRNPSITENIVDDAGVAVDLTGATVKFKAREFNATTLAVDAAATVVGAATAGNVRYDWSAGDITGPAGILFDAGRFLVWWEITSGGKTQDVMEAVIEVRAHAPETHAYVELEELKKTLSVTGQTYADLDMELALGSACRAVDEITHRRFWPDADVNQVRYYSPNGSYEVEIDDLITLTSVVSDYDGDGTFEQTWVENTDFTLEPLNAAADGRPWSTLCLRPLSAYRFGPYPRSLKVTGKFGWAAAPSGVKVATTQIATRVLKIMREAPFGVAAIGMDGAAIRISRTMPEVELALAPYVKSQILG